MSFERKSKIFRDGIIKSIEAEYQKRKMQEGKVESEDTKIRKEIHNFIRMSAITVKNKEKLLNSLKERFSAPEYEKYQKYFEQWVSDAIDKDEER